MYAFFSSAWLLFLQAAHELLQASPTNAPGLPACPLELGHIAQLQRGWDTVTMGSSGKR